MAAARCNVLHVGKRIVSHQIPTPHWVLQGNQGNLNVSETTPEVRGGGEPRTLEPPTPVKPLVS